MLFLAPTVQPSNNFAKLLIFSKTLKLLCIILCTNTSNMTYFNAFCWKSPNFRKSIFTKSISNKRRFFMRKTILFPTNKRFSPNYIQQPTKQQATSNITLSSYYQYLIYVLYFEKYIACWTVGRLDAVFANFIFQFAIFVLFLKLGGLRGILRKKAKKMLTVIVSIKKCVIVKNSSLAPPSLGRTQ